MKDFFKSIWYVIQDQIEWLFDFNFTWLSKIKSTLKEYEKEWKAEEPLNKIWWVFEKVIELWLFWIITIPLILFFSKIIFVLNVIFAKFYLTIWLAILPFLLFFAILSFIETSWIFFFKRPRFEKKRKFIIGLSYIVFLSIAFLVDIHYHEQIESFLTDESRNLEVNTNDSYNT